MSEAAMSEAAMVTRATTPPSVDADGEVVVSMRDAAVVRGGRRVWSHVDFDVRRGEFVAVLGPNGAGKSTLLDAVLGLIHPAAGAIRVLGGPPGEANIRVGYLPQRRSFPSDLRVRGVDIVRLGLDGHRWGVPLPGLGWRKDRRNNDVARVREVIDLVGAGEYAHRPVGQVSGGEQQRLLIAQALVQEPDLLLLDEPLDSLDLPNQAAVAGLVARICRERDVAVLLVAHDVNPILSHVDRVVYLAAGTAMCGQPHDVITTDALSRLYGVPVEVLTTSDGRLVVVGSPEAPAAHADRHPHH